MLPLVLLLLGKTVILPLGIIGGSEGKLQPSRALMWPVLDEYLAVEMIMVSFFVSVQNDEQNSKHFG